MVIKMETNWVGIVIMTTEICGLGITIASAIFKFYTRTIQRLQNHEMRLNSMEKRLDRIERKINTLNGWVRYNKGKYTKYPKRKRKVSRYGR